MKTLNLALGTLLLLGITAIVLLATRQFSSSRTTSDSSNPATDGPSASEKTPQPQRYQILVEELKTKHATLSQRWKTAKTDLEKSTILSETRNELEATMPELMTCWNGTPWDFHGTSQTPGEGHIACGYFVSVILRDTGFKVHRVRLAQQASQNIIISMIHNQDKTVIRHRKPYEAFISQFKAMPKGIYIIGLDTHVGFLLHNEEGIHFHHSGGRGVTREVWQKAYDIKISKYRVVGNLTIHDYLLIKWLEKSSIETQV